MVTQRQVSQKAYVPSDGFIKDFQKLIKNVVLPYQYDVLNDAASDNGEKSHVIRNFINAGSVLAGNGPGDGFYGMVFQDSDAAKWLEAAAFSLSLFPDAELEQKVDDLVDIIAAAQDSDGYLDTYFTIKDQDKRWTNLCEGHELYCAGHMIEAACAYYESTGKKKLLDVMTRNVECMYRQFLHNGDQAFSAYPGHPEVELALMKMYQLTGNRHCFDLAHHFIEVRGVDPLFFEKECAGRGWTVWGSDGKNPRYNQAHAPVREQKDAVGHAVRAVYLYTAMAHLTQATGDDTLLAACKNLWNSITRRQMYITGGIGSTVLGEAFSADYDLPSDTAYCETCASIGLMYFASRLLEIEPDGEYGDVMEKAFYNTVLGGMQSDGKRFFYVNPLEVVPGIAGTAVTHMHDLPQRPTWYACACCPPNVARTVSSLGKYAWGENETTAYCHLYTAGTVTFSNGMKLTCRTEYPYGFSIEFTVESAKKGQQLAVRIPAWSRTYAVQVSRGGKPAEVETAVQKGYLYLNVAAGDVVMLTLDDRPYFVYPSPRIPDLSGQVAVCRGPLVYCAEGIDNGDDVLALSIDTSRLPEVQGRNLNVHGLREKVTERLYTMDAPETEPNSITMIPYYTWSNRGITQMKVWFPKK
ncbi:MAG: glycoside hydrolase family 127 protein [Treponemataceae bacterium]|nr:glycoside hydrolase family 127 protein [Treponemataceae bacterium]